jgi:glycosyltransferase involved in cell wall biosynthesis
MERRITPLRDLGAVWRLWAELRAIRPDIVHSHTPKGGLLGMLAATLAGVPVRVYHLRGLPHVTASGPRRWLLVGAERVSCALAHRVLAVSRSMRSIAIADRLCAPGRIRVLANGSGQGVDAAGRFRPLDLAARRAVRARQRIPPDAPVVGFVGRLVRDKGIVELEEAWSRLRAEDPRLHLLLVGRREADDAASVRAIERLDRDDRVRFTGFDLDTPRLYAAMDVVALPTWREGFPNVALEAAAMALPIVATDVPGCVDAVLDGVTGALVPARDPRALADALRRYLGDAGLRERHGRAARARVLEEFRPEAIWRAIAEEYTRLLAEAGRS